MANGLVTTAQFPGLVPDIGALGRGAAQTIQLAGGLQQLKAGKQQLAAQEQERELKSMVQGAFMTSLIPTVEGKVNFLEKRTQEILRRGGNPSDTQEVLNLFKSGRIQEGNALLDQAVQAGQQFGILKASSGGKTVEAITPEGIRFVPEREAISKEFIPAGPEFRKQELEARNKERALQEQTNRLRRIELTTKLNTQERAKVTEKLKKQASRREKIFEANITVDKAKKALTQTGIFSTGVIGQLTGVIGGTPANKLRATTETLISTLRLGKIAELKELSPTGSTGLGQVAIPEFTALGNAVTNLDPSQGPEQLTENLNEVINRFERVSAIAASDESIQSLIDEQFDEYLVENGTADGFSFNENKVVITNHPKFGDVTIAEIYKAAIKNATPYDQMFSKLMMDKSR